MPWEAMGRRAAGLSIRSRSDAGNRPRRPNRSNRAGGWRRSAQCAPRIGPILALGDEYLPIWGLRLAQLPMSIYKPLVERALSDNDVTHTVRSTAAPKAPSPAKNEVAPELIRLRRAKPINHLLPASIKWLGSLPDQVRPMALANQYPRIANLLALDWNKPAACRQYLDELLIDHRRGNRRGFPLDVHRELEILRDYYHSQHPGT